MGKWICYDCKEEKGMFDRHWNYKDDSLTRYFPRLRESDKVCKNCLSKYTTRLGIKIPKKKIILIGIPVFLVLFFVVFPILYQHDLKINHPEEYAKLEAQWAIEREKERQEEIREIEKREIEAFESATVPSGSFGMEKLKYRPYWLVGDEWKEKERTGKIVKSQDCVNAVTMINDNLGSIQKTFYKAWLIECVK